jgi:hypothetical protein
LASDNVWSNNNVWQRQTYQHSIFILSMQVLCPKVFGCEWHAEMKAADTINMLRLDVMYFLLCTIVAYIQYYFVYRCLMFETCVDWLIFILYIGHACTKNSIRFWLVIKLVKSTFCLNGCICMYVLICTLLSGSYI